jgi:putative lipoprotein
MATVLIDVNPPAVPPAGAVTIYARVEDVSAADAPARTVAERVLDGVRLDRPLHIALDVDPIDPRARYSVRVHADASGSARVEPGDFVTTRSYPVLTQGGGESVAVDLTRV